MCVCVCVCEDIVSNLSISMTSSLTHNISGMSKSRSLAASDCGVYLGTAKSAVQTGLAYLIYQNAVAYKEVSP